MVIEQQKFFEGLNFEECGFKYPTGERKCFKGIDGGYYRVDHFGKSYVVEYAENEYFAKANQFEDTNLYDDSLPQNKIISMIQSDLKEFISE